jgi:Fe-S cluster assembly protein SufB
MSHVGKNTRSRIVSKGISAGGSNNCYRGLVQVGALQRPKNNVTGGISGQR